MSISRSFVLTAVLVLLLSGCLPYTCRQTEPRELFPSDSLSRSMAARITPDSLRLLRQSRGSETQTMKYPTSIVQGPDGRLFVSDARQNAIYIYTSDGRFENRFRAPSLSYPFLAGFRADTLIALNRGTTSLNFIVDTTVVRSIDLPKGPGAMAVANESGIYYKVVEDDPWFGSTVPGYITRVTAAGDTTMPRVQLPGPFWRHRGFMRFWGDTLVSLSGYRPVIDLISPNGTLDTLALRGFDSPMLARSRSFQTGTVDTAPVLTSSAVPADSQLYVLNLRPHLMRIDVYDRNGRLQKVYQEAVRPSPNDPDVFPMDFTLIRDSTGTLRFPVVMFKPNPSLRIYETR